MSVPRFKPHQYDGRTGRRRRHPDDGYGTEPHSPQALEEQQQTCATTVGAWGLVTKGGGNLKNALIVYEKTVH
jgi:hypothetical protein